MVEYHCEALDLSWIDNFTIKMEVCSNLLVTHQDYAQYNPRVITTLMSITFKKDNKSARKQCTLDRLWEGWLYLIFLVYFISNSSTNCWS